VQLGTQRHASPREQPFKLHRVWSRVNNHSPPNPRGRPQRRHELIMPLPVCNYVHRIMLQFCLLLYIYHSCGQLPFPCLASSSSCAILSQAGLLEVPMTLSGVPWLFSCSTSGVLNGRYSEKLMLNGGSREYSLLSLVLYPKPVYFASLMLTAEY
jgi:hypothetical protein